MRRLSYSFNVSLDGYVAGPDGELDWSVPSEAVHRLHNDLAREAGAFLYGRRLYELMAAAWPTADADPDVTDVERDFARIWREKPKVVFSGTLDEVSHRSRLVADDAVAEVVRLKGLSGGPLQVGGATLAATLIRAGLVDEFHTFVYPVVLGSGKRYLPDLDHRVSLRLTDSRTFASGVVFLRHDVTNE